jgi:Ribulose kinase
MFRMWIKLWKDNRLVKDLTVENGEPVNRTKKVFEAVDRACSEWDLPKPIWLQNNLKEFKKTARTRFGQDSFIEHIDFDWLELHVIEEDSFYGGR